MNFPRSVLTMILFLLAVGEVSSQSHTIDSLKALLTGTNDQQQADLYLELAFETMNAQPRQGLGYARQLYATASKLQDSLRMLKGARLEALAYRKLEKLDSSNIVSLKILPLARRMTMGKDVTLLLNGLAIGHMWTADYDQSLLFNLQCHASAVKIQDSSLITASLNNLGLLYYKINDHPKAINYYQQALRCRYNGIPNAIIGQTYLNLALCYIRDKDLKNAQKCLMNAAPLVPGAPAFVKFDYYFNRGLYFKQDSQIDSALINQSFALDQATSMNSTMRQNISSIELADLYLMKNDIPSSIKYLKMAESLIVPSSYKSEILTTYNLLALLNHRLGNWKMAWQYQQKYIELNDSIYSSKFVNKLVQVEKDFLEQKKNEEIRKEKEVVAQKEATIRQKTIIIALSSIIAVLVSCVAIVLLKAYRQKKLLNDLLDKKVHERTDELRSSENKLKRICEEQVEGMKKLKAEVSNSNATIEGLCAAALRDERLCEPAKEYLTRISDHVK